MSAAVTTSAPRGSPGFGVRALRNPSFLIGALLCSLGLIVMPFSPALWFAAGLLWILDASINIAMEPFRAFVGDMLRKDQHTAGYSVQTAFIGAGAVVERQRLVDGRRHHLEVGLDRRHVLGRPILPLGHEALAAEEEQA